MNQLFTPPHELNAHSTQFAGNSSSGQRQPGQSHPKRIVWLDLLKFFTIFLVIWGHVILYCRPNEEDGWTDSQTLIWIYSFHMPLFMMVTGLIYAMTFKHGFLTTIKKKFRQLLLPALTFGLIIAAINIWLEINDTYGSKPNPPLREFWNQLWFLKSAFVCCMVSYPFFAYKGRFSSLWIALVAIGSQFIPETPIIRYVYMLPFFLIGGLIFKYLEFFKRHSIATTVISGILFFLLLFFFSNEIYIKCSITYNWETINRYPTLYLYRAYRILVGLSGSLFFIALFICLFDTKYANNKIVLKFAILGQLTLGIYAIHCIAIRKYAHLLFFAEDADTTTFTFFYTPLFAILLLSISIALTKLAKSNRWTAWLFLGSPRPTSKE